MNIVLISANKLTEPYPVYPLGLDYVAGVLSPEHKVIILDMNEFEDAKDLCRALKDIPADIIGVSLRNIDNTDATNIKYFLTQYQNLIIEIRKNSKAKIVLGGSAFTIFPREFMKAMDADYGIIGEGERFNLFLNKIIEDNDPLEIAGVIAKSSVIRIPEPWDAEIQRRFSADTSNVKYYINKGGMLNLQTKRGCTFRCIYCTYPHIEGQRLRLFPPDEIAKTARRLQDADAKYIFITDSAFNCSYQHSTETAKAFVKAGLSIPWGAFFAPTRPPDDYYRILADAGLTHVEFGTESMSDIILENYRKPFKVDDVFASHDAAFGAGLNIAHYLLPGGPGENSNTLEESLTNADKLSKTVFFIFCGMRIFPDTELFEIAKAEGQVNEAQNLLEPVFYRPGMITIEEITARVEAHANGRSNWIIGSGGKRAGRLMKRMYQHGYTGPLWEHLIQQ